MKCISDHRTIFGSVKGNNVIFCIDKSGSCSKIWDIVCTHLAEHLCKLAMRNKLAKFNVIVFDDQVESFRSKLNRITTQCIFDLKNWLQNMCHGGNSYLLPALMAAFSNSFTDCVYLVSDGLSMTESPELLYHLPRICNGRPLHVKLISNRKFPHLPALRFLAKLVSLSCCCNSSLSIVNVKHTGVFTYLSPSDWSCKIPEYLYGNPDASYKHMLESWNHWRTQNEGFQERLSKEIATSCNTDCSALVENSVRHLPGTPIKKSQLRRLSKHDRSTQYWDPLTEELGQPVDTDMCDSNISDMEAHSPKPALTSDFPLPNEHVNCRVVHANTTGVFSPAVCCRSECHHNCATAARNHTQHLSSSRANSEPAEYSRFRASRLVNFYETRILRKRSLFLVDKILELTVVSHKLSKL
ncbi:hypothetical protein AHF37_06080 [Paragonimus kellicotti]|nr:hypothetical protein AHF37_06080 [Paragonimus kellicotti]